MVAPFAWGGVYANGELVAAYSNGTTHFPLSASLRTLRVWMTSGGTTSQTCANLAFGDASTCNADAIQFTGQYHDNAPGLDNFKARYDSPVLGQFISHDPAGAAVVDPNGPSPFQFASLPGHLLYPATISFSAYDTGPGQITSKIAVPGQTSGFESHALFNWLGGAQFEARIWDNLPGNAAARCGN